MTQLTLVLHTKSGFTLMALSAGSAFFHRLHRHLGLAAGCREKRSVAVGASVQTDMGRMAEHNVAGGFLLKDQFSHRVTF